MDCREGLVLLLVIALVAIAAWILVSHVCGFSKYEPYADNMQIVVIADWDHVHKKARWPRNFALRWNEKREQEETVIRKKGGTFAINRRINGAYVFDYNETDPSVCTVPVLTGVGEDGQPLGCPKIITELPYTQVVDTIGRVWYLYDLRGYFIFSLYFAPPGGEEEEEEEEEEEDTTARATWESIYA